MSDSLAAALLQAVGILHAAEVCRSTVVHKLEHSDEGGLIREAGLDCNICNGQGVIGKQLFGVGDSLPVNIFVEGQVSEFLK